MMYLTEHYPPPGSMGSMGPYQYAHPGADYAGAAGYKMDYTKAGAEYGRAPCSYEGMPPMMAHPGLDYDFTRLDIYGRAKQGRAKGIILMYLSYLPFHLYVCLNSLFEGMNKLFFWCCSNYNKGFTAANQVFILE